MAAPAIAGTTTADVQDASNSSNTSSQAISLPTSHAAGNLLVLVVSFKNGGTATTVTISTTGTAWTQKSSVQATTNALTETWYVRDGGSEPSSVTVNFAGTTGRCSLKMVRITGAKASGDPFDVYGTWSTATGSTTQVAPAVTTTQADCLLLSAVIAQVGTTGTVTAPGSGTMRELGAEVISNAASSGTVLDLADETKATAGATGTRTWVFNTSSNGAAVLFAIAPAASTPGSGSGTGSWTFTGAAAGARASQGTGTGSWTFTGAASGTTAKSGAGTGSWAFAGAAAGAASHQGTGTGSWAFTGTAAGEIDPAGDGSGSWSYTGAANGTAPGVDDATGSGAGSWLYTGAASGTQAPSGTGTGSWAYVGAAAGTATNAGAGTGTWTYTGTAAGTGHGPADFRDITLTATGPVQTTTWAGTGPVGSSHHGSGPVGNTLTATGPRS